MILGYSYEIGSDNFWYMGIDMGIYGLERL